MSVRRMRHIKDKQPVGGILRPIVHVPAPIDVHPGYSHLLNPHTHTQPFLPPDDLLARVDDIETRLRTLEHHQHDNRCPEDRRPEDRRPPAHHPAADHPAADHPAEHPARRPLSQEELARLWEQQQLAKAHVTQQEMVREAAYSFTSGAAPMLASSVRSPLDTTPQIDRRAQTTHPFQSSVFQSTGFQPTGVHPTGVHPTGVHPTGVQPTGFQPSPLQSTALQQSTSMGVAAAFNYKQLPPPTLSTWMTDRSAFTMDTHEPMTREPITREPMTREHKKSTHKRHETARQEDDGPKEVFSVLSRGESQGESHGPSRQAYYPAIPMGAWDVETVCRDELRASENPPMRKSRNCC